MRPWQLVHRCALGSSTRTTRSGLAPALAFAARAGWVRRACGGDDAAWTSSKMRWARAKSGSSSWRAAKASSAEADVAYEVAEVALTSDADEREPAESDSEGT